MNIIIFLIILLVLVVAHEFGHFIVAKKNGIRVDEFSFGFPPKLFGKKIGETTYNFNALPLGGYVKIFGENPDEESISGPDSSRSFVNKKAYVQAAVLLAGVTMNFLKREYQCAIEGRETPDCHYETCNACGLQHRHPDCHQKHQGLS